MYTFPDGLQSVNGSSSTGGCQRECVMMTPTDAINGCDCPGSLSTPANGVLIDDVIPSIDTTQRGTWATELFVVNRNGQYSFMIGFQFNTDIHLRGVEVTYLDCQIWGTGASVINVYSSYAFPTFYSSASTHIGVLSLVGDTVQSCTSLKTVSIPTQPMEASSLIFIEFSFVGGSSVHPLNWLHLAEIRFSDVTPMPEVPVTERTTTSAEGEEYRYTKHVHVIHIVYCIIEELSTTTTVLLQPSTVVTTGEHLRLVTTNSTIGSSPTFRTINQDVSTTVVMTITPSKHTTPSIPWPTIMSANAITPRNSTIDVSSLLPTVSQELLTTIVMAITSSNSEQELLEVSKPTAVEVLVGVIVLLTLIILGGGAFLSCLVFYKRRKVERLNTQRNHAQANKLSPHENPNSMSTCINSSYSSVFHLTRDLPDHPPVPSNPEIDEHYSEIRGKSDMGRNGASTANSGLYDDISENPYSMIPEIYTEAVQVCNPLNVRPDARQTLNSIPNPELDGTFQVQNPVTGSSLINSQLPPPVPKKSGKLKWIIDRMKVEETQNHQTELDPQLQIPTIAVVPVGTCNRVEKEAQKEEENYIDMSGSTGTPSQSPSRFRRSSYNSGPVLLSRSVCHIMEDNPTYDSSWSLLHDLENHGENIYTNPGADFQGESQLTVYEAVYSDSLVRTSFLGQKVEQPQSNDKPEQGATMKSRDKEKRGDEMVLYAPIYLLHDASPLLEQQPLIVTDDNIRGVKVLGTGFFGKVVLADTVGLSLKDLKLSDDDDKSVSVRVAVKKLKLNASKSIQEAFEKECAFMSRLDHPNVIRLLGMCTTGSSRFIMMEFMERGDLNNYLTNFKMIVSEGVPKEKEIPVSTLVYMCTQIANAMKYLVSRNFIHRDLAARNCLVGPDNLIKIADFGMSRSLYESHYYIIHGQAVLPVRWMATECFYGKFSAKTDVWAFGVTMWEIFILAKERPYSCLLYTSPSPRDATLSRMPSSA